MNGIQREAESAEADGSPREHELRESIAGRAYEISSEPAFLSTPSFFIFAWSVVGFSPRSFAAPLSPLTRPPVKASAFWMCSRSSSLNVGNPPAPRGLV